MTCRALPIAEMEPMGRVDMAATGSHGCHMTILPFFIDDEQSRIPTDCAATLGF